MKALRYILVISVLLFCVGYLIASLTILNRKPDHHVCGAVTVEYKSKVDVHHVDRKEVIALLKTGKVYPVGKQLKDINTAKMEQALRKHSFIEEAECYITSGGNVMIEVYERTPLLHVLSSKGEDYYIDKDGYIFAAGMEAIYLPVVTGEVTRDFAKKTLPHLAQLLHASPFWSAQVAQIHVTPKQELELVPRVGEHTLFLGKAENLEEKLRKLEDFYTHALPTVGWNKYGRINIEFDNQIICTKR